MEVIIPYDNGLSLWCCTAQWYDPQYGGRRVEYRMTHWGARRAARKMIKHEKRRRRELFKSIAAGKERVRDREDV